MWIISVAEAIAALASAGLIGVRGPSQQLFRE
jgi:hypothetical protein